jgi:hypothetical protein
VGSFSQTYGLYLLLSALGGALIAIYALLEAQIAQDAFWPLVIVFLIQQAYMIARMWLKACFYSSQTHLYRSQPPANIAPHPAVESLTAS